MQSRCGCRQENTLKMGASGLRHCLAGNVAPLTLGWGVGASSWLGIPLDACTKGGDFCFDVLPCKSFEMRCF